jgi:hypothetical protein
LGSKSERSKKEPVLISGEEGKRSVSNKMTLGGYQPNPTNSLPTQSPPRSKEERRLHGSCAAPKHQRHFQQASLLRVLCKVHQNTAARHTFSSFNVILPAEEMDNNNNNKANPRGTNFPIFFLHTISIMSCCELAFVVAQQLRGTKGPFLCLFGVFPFNLFALKVLDFEIKISSLHSCQK